MYFQFTALAVLLLCVGCVAGGASQLPPPLTAQEEMRLEKARLPYSVGVVSKLPTNYYRDDCIAILQRTHLFTRVDYLERFSSPPDLIAEPSGLKGGTATVPIAALLTFGVAPSECQEAWGIDFLIKPSMAENSPANRENQCRIRYWHKGTSLLGMKAWFLVLTGDWALHPDRHPRICQRVALTILDHAEEIEHIAQMRSSVKP